ncbi:gamma-glutamyltransferase [Alkalinema sp. FACHB-956]|nr:gamma-glutamyltransferase [Alkalinema sp. FACHB-956]
MVTSAHPLASQIGRDVLKKGGNAVDAAVATTLAISVVEPFSAGLGGGGFLLFYDGKTGKTVALDFRERAPLQATRNLYLDARGKVRPQASTKGALAVAVPGTIAGLAEVHQRYGKLPWQTLVEPAIDLAEQGFPVSWQYTRTSQGAQAVLQQPEAQRIFTHQGQPLQPGDRLIQTDLAKTLRSIAISPQNFYRGTIAQAIVQDVQVQGGILSIEDLRTYRPIWRQPLCGPFRQYQVCSMPPPSSGGVHLLQMLNLLDTPALHTGGWHHPDTVQMMVEAMRIAYRDRAQYLGDPDFVAIPVQGLISPAYAQRRRTEIKLNQATPSGQVPLVDPWAFQPVNPKVPAANPAGVKQLKPLQPQESDDTSHLTVVDRDRNAVSLTFTINLGFGSGVVPKGTGVLLNNEMDDFAVAPNTPNAFGLVGDEANAIAPRKTPLSSMTPTIVTEKGKFRMAVGSPGGSTIITTVLQSLLNHLVHGMDIRRSIAAPRIHHQWLPDELRVEQWGLDPLTRQALEHRGQLLRDRDSWGNANGIVALPDGRLEGAADPRGEGAAAGW